MLLFNLKVNLKIFNIKLFNLNADFIKQVSLYYLQLTF